MSAIYIKSDDLHHLEYMNFMTMSIHRLTVQFESMYLNFSWLVILVYLLIGM